MHRVMIVPYQNLLFKWYILSVQAQADMLLWQKEIKLGLKEDLTSLAHYALLTGTVGLSYQGVRKTVETKEYADYIPEAWVGLIKVMMKCVLY